jgi:hypothetical protein
VRDPGNTPVSPLGSEGNPEERRQGSPQQRQCKIKKKGGVTWHEKEFISVAVSGGCLGLDGKIIRKSTGTDKYKDAELCFTKAVRRQKPETKTSRATFRN